MKYLIGLLSFCFFIFFTPQANATHMFGQDMSYRCLGNDQYEIIFRQYWGGTCNTTSSPAYQIKIEAPSCNQSFTDNLPFHSMIITPNVNSFCITIRVWKGVITLPTNCPDWHIYREDCCIWANNIIRRPFPSDRYVTEAYINNTNGLCNSSPNFFDIPPFRACVNQLFEYDFGAVMAESDGDSLVFILADVKNGDSSIVTYTTGFSGVNPFPTTTGINLNNATGVLSFTPSTVQHAVYNIVVEEYRNGVLIGKNRSVNGLFIDNCQGNRAPQIDSVWLIPPYGVPILLSNIDLLNLNACPSSNVHLRMKVVDPDISDTIQTFYPGCFNLFAGLSMHNTVTFQYPNANIGQYNEAIVDLQLTNIYGSDYRLALWDQVDGADYLFFNLDISNCPRVIGNVARDLNVDCLTSLVDYPLNDFIIKATKGSASPTLEIMS